MPIPARAAANSIRFQPTDRFNGVKIISATMAAERDRLGDKVTEWIANHPKCEVVEILITQSSDERFHCVVFWIFYYEEVTPNRRRD